MAEAHPTVDDVFGDQVQIEGRWYHAHRVLGRPASSFRPGDAVVEWSVCASPVGPANSADEWVSPSLYRGSGANVTSLDKVIEFARLMREAGGFGPFPMVTGRVEVVTLADVARCSELSALGDRAVWTSELDWSRSIGAADVGRRYVHLENGHHRMAAAALLEADGVACSVPVFDLNVEERESDRFLVSRP